MPDIGRDENVMLKYLLGELPPEERSECEARYFADDGFFEDIQALEWELLRDLARGDLSGARRRRFQKVVDASPDLRQKLASVQHSVAMQKEARGPEAKFLWFSLPLWKSVLTTAALAIAALTGWQDIRLRSELQDARVKSEALAAKAVESEGSRFVLLPGDTRGPSGNPVQAVQVARAEKTASFMLPLPLGPPSGSYSVVLRNADEPGDQWSATLDNPHSGNALTARIPLSILKRGDYYFTVAATGPGAGGPPETFVFRVETR